MGSEAHGVSCTEPQGFPARKGFSDGAEGGAVLLRGKNADTTEGVAEGRA